MGLIQMRGGMWAGGQIGQSLSWLRLVRSLPVEYVLNFLPTVLKR